MTNPEEQGRVTASEEREKIAAWLDKEADSYAQLARSSDTVETATHWNICEMTARHAKWKIRDGAHHEERP